MKTAAVISYCSYQKDFIKPLIKEARKFIDGEIVVVSFDKFFDGKDDEPLQSFGEIDLRLKFVPGQPSRYYHNLQRKAGFDVLQGDYEAVFFFDGDEVPIGEKMKEWLETAEVADYRFASHWYYRDTCFLSSEKIDSLALVSMKSLKEDCVWFNNNEREGFAKYDYWRRLTKDWEGKPMVHHYGWAGTKEMLLRKVQSWGHNGDMDWVSMVEEEFKHPFNYTCPFKKYEKYTKVEPEIGFIFNKDDMKKIGIQVPTRSRPDRLKVLYESWLVNNEGNSELVVGIDEDEKELYSWVYEHSDIKVIDTPRKDYVEKANYMIERMKEYDYIYLLADDFVINSKFESIFLAEAVPNCVFYGRDSYMNSKLPTAPFMDNNIFRKLGYVAPPTLVHYFADNIWRDWGEKAGTYRYFENVNVQHLHVVVDNKYADEVYNNSNIHFGADQEAYNKYIAEGLDLDIKKLL